MRITAIGKTDVGRKREANQDSYLVDEELRLYVVADGMGGHAGGETASKIAVESIHANLRDARKNGSDPFSERAELEKAAVPDHFREAVEAACYNIFQEARRQPRLQGMGTTVISLLIKESVRPGQVDAYFAHVGDSRAYLVRDELVQQISEDHSLVNEQIKAGVLTPEEAKFSRFKNIITRSVGFEEAVLVDVMGLWSQPGDVFVLCSDGLTGFVDDDEILQMVREHAGERIQELPQHLIDLANDRGGDDNITVIVVRVEDA